MAVGEMRHPNVAAIGMVADGMAGCTPPDAQHAAAIRMGAAAGGGGGGGGT